MTQGSETRRRKQKNTHPLSGKILFSLIMVSCYLFGKKVMIPWVVQDRNPPARSWSSGADQRSNGQ